MAGRDVLTTRVGEIVKVEIKDRTNPHGTIPNYGNVRPDSINEKGFYWHLASGENGTALTEQKAINAAARALRKHAAEKQRGQTAVAHVPASVVEAVNKIIEHYGATNIKEFYSADGEAMLTYRDDDRSGTGKIHIVPDRQKDTLVCILHTLPGSTLGLPDVFVAAPMYDVTKDDWWASPLPKAQMCPGCGEPIEGFPAMSRFDNATKICNGCGNAEAMGDEAGLKLLGPGQVDG